MDRNTNKESMEGALEESDDDIQGENKPTVIWEKCIQQSIFVDLSEDESLHLSDLENSLAFHLSQAESAASDSSIHFSAGSAELSALDVTSSESSIVSNQSKVVEEHKSCLLSNQRPNTMHDESPLNQGYGDPGQNTSEEDQDDLPYDGDLMIPIFNQTANSEGSSSDGRQTIHASPDDPGLLEYTRRDAVIESFISDIPEKLTSFSWKDAFNASNPCAVVSSWACPADINQLLLRHFSQEELLQSGRLIEAETLPEVSLLESVDDTVFSSAPKHNSTINSNDSPSLECNSEINKSFCSGSNDENSNTASRNSSFEMEAPINIYNTATESVILKTAGSSDLCAVDAAKQENAEDDNQVIRSESKIWAPVLRTRSFSEMKYGQGQVHYPLPDFSKVAPKVKIPKATIGQARPVSQSSGTLHRTQSSPVMIEVISRVLEDSVQPSENPYIFEEKIPPTPEHHLQAEYDKLLIKYADTESHIDQMRPGTNCNNYHQENLAADDGSHLGSTAPHLPPSDEKATQRDIKDVDTASFSTPEQASSDGERMTTALRGIISMFVQKVEEFKLSVSNMSISTEEQQLMLRSIMETQDLMERKYISTKEEHRTLEMQNYMGLPRNTGTFDPNRLVEGEIFRIGMYIEDIKEMIDKNVCEQISLPHSSTPTFIKEMLHEIPSLLCLSTPSLTPSPQEDSCAETTCKEEEIEGVNDVNGDNRSQESGGLLTNLLKNMTHSSYSSRNSRGSLEGLTIQTTEAEDERSSDLSAAADHCNILDFLSGATSSPGNRQWIANSCSAPDSILDPVDECDLGDCVSLAVEVSASSDASRGPDKKSLSEPTLNTSSGSQSMQRIVSPETDSGFGSSYLNQASGPVQPNLQIENVKTQNDALSSSDSDSSNLHTTIHSASLIDQQRAGTQPFVQTPSCGSAVDVQQWVDGTNNEPPVRLKDPTELHHNASEPVLSSTMDGEEKGSPQYSCSCNSLAILALQSEVSRLKKDVEEGFVQLPQLAQKMDYLSSKCRHDRQERRSKTRTRGHHGPACNREFKLSSSKIDDWISSDLEPSKSKGTDSGGTAGSEILLQNRRSSMGSRTTNHFPNEFHWTLGSNKGSAVNTSVNTSDLSSSLLKVGEEEDYHAKQSQRTAIVESVYSKERFFLFSNPSLQKPLLQVSYTSSSSLPASYKVRESQLQSSSYHRKPSSQSDTALLPSNVFFQRTMSPVSMPSRNGSRTGRHRENKEEEINRNLDQAIEVARSLKRTTDRMAKGLSADLARAQMHKNQHIKPVGGRKHQAL